MDMDQFSFPIVDLPLGLSPIMPESAVCFMLTGTGVFTLVKFCPKITSILLQENEMHYADKNEWPLRGAKSLWEKEFVGSVFFVMYVILWLKKRNLWPVKFIQMINSRGNIPCCHNKVYIFMSVRKELSLSLFSSWLYLEHVNMQVCFLQQTSK